MRNNLVTLAAVVLILGCAKVSVGGSKDPIKVDISMRLDVYQHVEKDIDAIEGIVSGSQEKNKVGDKQTFLNIFVSNAYAQEDLSPEVEQAALRRKARAAELYSWEAKGVIGENKSGLVELRDAAQGGGANQLIQEENSDRMAIYQALAAKNGTSVEEVQNLYAKKLFNNAPAGAPEEILNGSTGSYEWKVK